MLAFTAFSKALWRQAWPNNAQNRLNREIPSPHHVVGIVPDRHALNRLVGPVLAEQHCIDRRRYLGLGLLAKARTSTTTIREEVMDTKVPTLSVQHQRFTAQPLLHAEGLDRQSAPTRAKYLRRLGAYVPTVVASGR